MLFRKGGLLEQPGRWQRMAVSTGFGTASLALFSYWVPSPSYNALTLQALLITVTALLFAEHSRTKESLLGWVGIGFGGWLAFMAKPTTAVALALWACVYLVASRKFAPRLIAISVGTALALLIASAFLIDGSVAGFVDRFQVGAELATSLDPRYVTLDILRLDRISIGGSAHLVLGLMVTTLFVGGALMRSRRPALRWTGLIVAALPFLFTFSTAVELNTENIALGFYRGWPLLSVPFAALLLGLSKPLSVLSRNTKARWQLALLLLALPHVFAFGTNNNYWSHGVYAGYFWVIAGPVFLAHCTPRSTLLPLLLGLGIATQALTASLLLTAVEAPYRQPQALREQNHAIEFGPRNSNLIVSKGFGEYIQTAVQSAEGAGFRAGTAVIDLTGRSPGLLFALDALNIGRAWMVGGYPGSDQVAMKRLRSLSCDQLASSWLLVEPDGPQHLSAGVLASFGANLESDYEMAASWKSAAGAGNHPKRMLQQLMRPVRAPLEAASACHAAK